MTGYFNFLADAAAEVAEKEHSMGVVAGLGMGTVFTGLICLVILISIMNVIFSKIKPKEQKVPEAKTVATATEEKMDEETVAAVSAAVAEMMGRDVSAIRITSIKKLN